MAVARNRFVIQGTLPGGEVWSTGAHLIPPAGQAPVPDYENLQGAASILRDALLAGRTTTYGPIFEALSSSASMRAVRMEYIDSNGVTAQAAEAQFSPIQAGTGTATKPYQVSWCASLLTGRPGRSYRGRMYFPALGAPMNAGTLRPSTGQSLAFAGSVRALLVAAASALYSVPGQPGVYSLTKDVLTPVSEVAVGDVLDVQRRRRDTLVEVYSSVAV